MSIELTEEEYKRIIEEKEKAEQMGYRIIEGETTVTIVTPSGEKYVYAKPQGVEAEVETIELPREGKRYKAVVTRIKIAPMYKLFMEKGFNVERMIDKCGSLKEPRDRWYCLKRLKDTGYLVEFEVKELNMTDYEIIRFSVHRNSRFRELATCYKMFRKGQEIHVVLQDNGRFKIVCPEE